MFASESDRAARVRVLVKSPAVATAALLLLAVPALSQSAYGQSAQDATATAPAASAAPATSGENQPLQEVVVTGTLILRNGYEAPTPMTVVSAATLTADQATPNLVNALNDLTPAISGSSLNITESNGLSSSGEGLSLLNLRNLGANRNLVLFDGQRSVPSDITNDVDINDFPQQLIQRVDVVTGGGSSVYGSDAIGGVINFILNKTFTGLEVDAAGGETTYGDAANADISMTYGTPFAGGRAHFLFSGQIANQQAVQGSLKRPWENAGWGIMNNPKYAPGNGQPYYLVGSGIGVDQATPGGIIFSGPLKGTYFGFNSVPLLFQYGPVTNDPWTMGGQWYSTNERTERAGVLETQDNRANVFSRLSYDVTDNINVFVQYSRAESTDSNSPYPLFEEGNGATLNCPSATACDAFIPGVTSAGITANSLAATMIAGNIKSFRIGSLNYNQPNIYDRTTRITTRYVVGADGKYSILDNNTYTWSAYFQYGSTLADTDLSNNRYTPNWVLATDAVYAPAGTPGVVAGTIVCRSTLTTPNNGCVPFNPLGVNNTTPAGLQYIDGTSRNDQTFEQLVWHAQTQGEPLSDWAGPVSLALDAEHRQDTAKGVPSIMCNACAGWTPALNSSAPWFAGNFIPFSAPVNAVTEVALETLVPLAKDMPFLKTFDFNGAIRYTDYRFSGSVETWKLGFTWTPITDLRVRGTRSFDIRAPNFNDLFNYVNTGNVSAFDPFTNSTPQYFGYTKGNPNLQPEKGTTNEFGIVFSPVELPGFQASVDWWHIVLTNQIASLSANQLFLFCYAGQAKYCSQITPNPLTNPLGPVTAVTTVPFNLAALEKTGIDYELDYTKQLAELGFASLPGRIALRVLVTQNTEAMTHSGVGTGAANIYSTLGKGNPPYWHMVDTLTYSTDVWQLGLTVRAQSDGVLDPRYIQCQAPNCPTSNTTNQQDGINDNHIPGFVYFDGSYSYNFTVGDNHQLQAFLNVRNLFNRAPGIVPLGPTDFTYTEILSSAGDGYDLLGREFRVGVRFKY